MEERFSAGGGRISLKFLLGEIDKRKRLLETIGKKLSRLRNNILEDLPSRFITSESNEDSEGAK